MTEKQFFNGIAGGNVDVIAVLNGILDAVRAPYCVIGGLGVNAYADPVVSLDVDIVVAEASLMEFLAAAEAAGFAIARFPNSVNLTMPKSDLRVQVQTDPRYQHFLPRSGPMPVLGYALHVADVEDVLLGKSWAYLDPARRPSKRQKDLADILRLIEARPSLRGSLLDELRDVVQG